MKLGKQGLAAIIPDSAQPTNLCLYPGLVNISEISHHMPAETLNSSKTNAHKGGKTSGFMYQLFSTPVKKDIRDTLPK